MRRILSLIIAQTARKIMPSIVLVAIKNYKITTLNP